MIQIGGTQVACGKEPYIIAEVSSNWKTFEDAILSIEASKTAGANAVKFQLYDYKALYGIPKGKKTAYDDSHDLPLDWLPKLKQQSDRLGIDFMCTVYDPEHVRVVDPYVYAHKVASSDINHLPLLREIDKMGKPVFLSVGAATPAEIEMAMSTLESVPVILMYCVSAYPAKTTDLTLIDVLKSMSVYVGYSDHTTDAVYLPYAAVKYHQACALEKHFTAIKEATPDSDHSLNPAQFKLMVDRIRGKRRGLLGPTKAESDMVLRQKRRLIATTEIKQGDVFRLGKNFGPYRSPKIDSSGLSPLALYELEGKKAAKDIEIGSPIKADDFE